MVGPNLMTGALPERRTLGRDIRHTSCEHKGRDWGNKSIRQRMSMIAAKQHKP